MNYNVTIFSSNGGEATYLCGGANDQVALIYAGKVVEAHADRSDPEAKVEITRDGEKIGPYARALEMFTRAV